MSHLLATAVRHHESGRLEEAGSIYRQILRSEPRNADALHLYGLLAHQCGDNKDAAKRIGGAVRINPHSALYRFNLGLVLAAQGDLEAAAESYRRAIALKPDFADAHNNLGQILEKRGRNDEAVACYEAATQGQPDHVAALVNLGKALQERRLPDQALARFERARRLRPDLAEAHFGVGKSHENQGAWRDAIAAYRQALALKPDFFEARNNLGTSLLGLGAYGEAQAEFRRVMELKRGPVRASAAALAAAGERRGAKPADERHIRRDRLADRTEQIEYLLAGGRIDRSFEVLAARCRSLLDAAEIGRGPKGSVSLPVDCADRIEALCDSVLRHGDAPAVPGCAVNGALAFRDIEDAYLSSAMPVVCFDDFLSLEGLRALRRFCLESTIFFGCDPAGFVSSYLSDGFNCDLLYQIAQELKERMPRVIGSQFLSNMWVYRHKSRGQGVVAHTDAAAVTFNFWFTPDSANLDRDRGGLVVYRKEEPLDWDWMEYNKKKNTAGIKAKIERFLSSAETVTIPYRENRAVLFHSNLFHRTDAFRFKDGFENRRLNASMLFGTRGAGTA